MLIHYSDQEILNILSEYEFKSKDRRFTNGISKYPICLNSNLIVRIDFPYYQLLLYNVNGEKLYRQVNFSNDFRDYLKFKIM